MNHTMTRLPPTRPSPSRAPRVPRTTTRLVRHVVRLRRLQHGRGRRHRLLVRAEVRRSRGPQRQRVPDLERPAHRYAGCNPDDYRYIEAELLHAGPEHRLLHPPPGITDLAGHTNQGSVVFVRSLSPPGTHPVLSVSHRKRFAFRGDLTWRPSAAPWCPRPAVGRSSCNTAPHLRRPSPQSAWPTTSCAPEPGSQARAKGAVRARSADTRRVVHPTEGVYPWGV